MEKVTRLRSDDDGPPDPPPPDIVVDDRPRPAIYDAQGRRFERASGYVRRLVPRER